MVNIKARTKSFFGQIPKKIRQVKFLLLTPTRALIVTLLHTRRTRKAKQYHAISCIIQKILFIMHICQNVPLFTESHLFSNSLCVVVFFVSCKFEGERLVVAAAPVS